MNLGDGECECFSIVANAMGRHMNGKPLGLYYDGEYKEADADFGAYFPVRKGTSKQRVSVRELSRGKVVSLIHKGPYDKLDDSYQRLFAYINEDGYKIQLPTLEIYQKGPGMVFKGNPKNYLTEIQMVVVPGA